MRSLTFIQYFTVGELIKLKLVHSHLNQILDQATLEMAIQIGNLSPEEREYYWSSKAKYTMDSVYKNIPSQMIDFLKSGEDPLLLEIRSTLMVNLPNLIDHDEEVLLKIIYHLYIDNQLYRIYEFQPNVRTKLFISLGKYNK